MICFVFLLLLIPITYSKDCDDQDIDKIMKKLDKIDIISAKEINVFGTEYQVGDNVRVFLQLLENAQPINNATCYINIIYPNNTIFKDFQIMMKHPSDLGLYYYDTFAPNQTGNYMLTTECFYVQLAENHNVSSYAIITGQNPDTGLITRTAVDDGVYWEIEDIDLPPKTINVNFTFNNISGNETNQSNIIIVLNGILEVGGGNIGVANLSVYNWSSSTFNILPNTWLGNDNQEDTISNTLPIPTLPDYILNGKVVVNIKAVNIVGEDLKKFKIDYFQIFDNFFLGQSINELRGGGEIHVRPKVTDELTGLFDNITYVCNQLPEYVWNYTNRTLTDIEEINYSKIATFVWNYTPRILSNFTFNVTIDPNQTLNIPEENQTAVFSVGSCVSNVSSAILLVVFLILAIFLLFIGFSVPIWGIFGSILLIVLSLYIVGCIGLIGYLIASLGVVLIIYYALKK